MKLIVSDATTLIVLHNIGRMEILKALFTQVIVPGQVYDEVCLREKNALSDPFFVIKKSTDRMLHKLLSKSLDAGESEAIVLAVEMKLPLIIDEKKGRKIARHMGVSIIGLLGILILACQKKIMGSKEVLLVYAQAKENSFRVSERLETQFLAQIAALEDHNV